ncbi:hypothetical protein QFC22_001534 [Naganishia vaughanmartiniae]|uniref:Uncharacterized protein n=1 Tax=Naganishia vaughanmartiniae TaxID=1424756 RepID=A0ACC2XIB9_9TREE|nr:hypothetical protein QFC22_001534 [Naganishia vaughanmartiniae]
MPKKSIFRQPGAQHFQLVHRSQRDPLINDPEASQRVFRPVERANDQGKKAGAESLAQLEQAVFAGNPSATNPSLRKNEGEASLYGIYYDDSSYDYMQHLRGVGESSTSGGVVDSVMLPAPGKGSHGASRGANKGKGRARDDDLNDEERGDLFGIGKRAVLPDSVLPSGQQLTREQAYEAQAAVPRDIAGFQPDMDPHLRQVLEALEDDAFVADEEEVDFMDDLLAEGERNEEEEFDEWEFQEWGADEEPHTESQTSAGPLADGGEDVASEDQTWEDRFKAFKASGKLAEVQKQAADVARSDADDGTSEMADTVASLPEMKVIGGKKRRKGASDASGYSMSSSSMFRNKGLSTLDEMFERKYEKEYAEEDEMDDEDFEGSEFMSESDFDDAASTSTFAKAMRSQLLARADENEPELTREDMEEIMDEFLDEFEIVGNKMLPKVRGETPAENLDIMRKALMGLDLEGSGPADSGTPAAEAEYIRKRFLREREEDEDEEQDKMPVLSIVGDKKDRWDAETILSTYSNIENHPAKLSVANKHPKKRSQRSRAATEEASDDEDEDSEDDTETESTYQQKVTVARPKGESKEERKARKAAVKAERQDRRFEKKTRQELFNGERKKQLTKHVQLVSNGKAADLTVSARDRVNTVKL